jgi:8-amino-7-oxononanoate synthase
MANKKLPPFLLKTLLDAQQKGTLKKLSLADSQVDFCSTDYLGFSRQGLLTHKLKSSHFVSSHYGAGGSRLNAGNSQFIEDAEKQIAMFHHAESALIVNSGYLANLALLSCLAQKDDLILYDEMVHASINDGIRLSEAKHYKVKHNDLKALKELIQKHQTTFRNIFIVVESVYANVGDLAPLIEISELIQKLENVFLIVDESHGIGVFGKQGRGLCNAMGIERESFARIFSFGKAMGCGGAAIVGSNVLRNYLLNFSRPVLHSTTPANHSVDVILNAYQLLIETDQKDLLQENISYFFSKSQHLKNLDRSQSAIHRFSLRNIEDANNVEKVLREKGILVRIFKNPDLKENRNEVRIYLHAFNTKQEIDSLLEVMKQFD